MTLPSQDVQAKMRKVRLLALDSDGVLTDGGVYILEDGGEFRRFDIHDGAGLKAVMQAGVRVAVISSGRSPVVQHRCKQLGIPDVYVGVDDKLDCLNAVCAKYGIELREVCYMGDDLVDLPVLKAVGLPCAPADAIPSVLEAAACVTQRAGGHGAVRELCDLLLREQAG